MRLYGIDRLIIFLALACVILSALLWLTAPRVQPLTDLSPEQVNEIRVLKEQKVRLGLLRDRAGWMLTHPDIRRASPERVAQLLGLLRTHSLGSWPASPGTLQRSGLTQPLRSLQFDSLPIDFGSASTPPGQRYIRVGDRVHLVDELWFKLTGLPADYFREQP